MCGLLYAHNFLGKPVNNEILNQYDKQKTRGQQGFGIFDGQEMNMVHETKEDSILKWLSKYDSNLLMMHHRFPTSTANVKRAAHPFSTKGYFGKNEYILIHNGHISNALDLIEEHEKLGIEYYSVLQDWSFNDSEALLWDFALLMEGKQTELKARGAMAIICLKLVKGKLEKMYFGRNVNPLVLNRTKEDIELSSEGEEGELVERDKLFTWHYKSKRLTNRPLDFPSYYVANTYTGNFARGKSDWDKDDWDKEDEDWATRSRIAKAFANSGFKTDNKVKKVIDFLEQDDGTMIEVETPEEHEENTLKLLTTGFDDKVSAGFTYTPTESEIEREYELYLRKAKNHFLTAYWLVENDHDAELEYPANFYRNKRLAVIEGVRGMLDTDPEYKDDKSCSTREMTWNHVPMTIV